MSIKNLFKKRLFSKKVIAKCGHETELKGEIKAFGEDGIITIPKNDDGTVDYCLKCLESMTERCAWCGKPIFIGDPITLYSPMDKKFKIPDYAVIYNKDPLQLVGCLRWECAESGADRAGFWIPPGKVYRVLSPLEQCMGNCENGNDEIVIVSDLHDPNQAIPIR